MTFSILYKTLIFATFADDNSLYSIEDNFKEAKTILKKNFELLQGWFYDMVLKSRKCHYLVINKDIANESIELGGKILHAESGQKLLGFKLSKPYKVDQLIKQLIKS